MQCQDIELLIIASSERPLNQEELKRLEQHLTQCRSCASFQADWIRIRQSIKIIPVPPLSSGLDNRTRQLCQETLKTQTWGKRISASRFFIRSLPKGIIAALISAAFLTVTALILFFTKFSTLELQAFKTAVILTLLLQNAVMLIFAPIIIDRSRRRKLNVNINLDMEFV